MVPDPTVSETAGFNYRVRNEEELLVWDEKACLAMHLPTGTLAAFMEKALGPDLYTAPPIVIKANLAKFKKQHAPANGQAV